MSESSAKEDLIELHYERLGEELVWTAARVRRLCSGLQITYSELARFIRVRPCDINKWIRTDSFPPTVELHLTLIERAVFPSVTKPPVFPCLSTSTS